jgi:uncharacterized membrane protein
VKRPLGLALSALSPLFALACFAPPGALPRLLENDRGLPFAPFWALLGLAHLASGVSLEDLPVFAYPMTWLRRAAASPSRLLGSLAIAAGGIFSLAALRRHDAFQTSYDLGVFDQVVWAAAHGHGLASSLQGSARSMFGMHFMPVLYGVAALYRLWESPRALLVLQAAALASSVIPAFLLARERLGAGRLAWLFAFAWLAFLPLRAMALWDFQPSSLAVPCLLWALWGAETSRTWALALGLGAACLCKETGFLAAAGLGLYLTRGERRRLGWAIAGLGVAGFLAAVGWLIPHARGGPDFFLHDRYAYLGDGLGEILLAPVRHPLRVLEGLVWPPRKIEYLLRLFGPFAFLSLVRPRWLLAFAPLLAVNLLADYPQMQSVHFQYNAELAGLIFAAAVDGTAALLAADPTRRRRLGLALLVCGSLCWGTGEPFEALAAPVDVRARQIDAALAQIPDEAPVAAQDDLLPHVAHHLTLDLIPRVDRAEYVAFDLSAALPAWNSTQNENQLLAATLLARGYQRVDSNGGFLLLRRGDPQARESASSPHPSLSPSRGEGVLDGEKP